MCISITVWRTSRTPPGRDIVIRWPGTHLNSRRRLCGSSYIRRWRWRRRWAKGIWKNGPTSFPGIMANEPGTRIRKYYGTQTACVYGSATGIFRFDISNAHTNADRNATRSGALSSHDCRPTAGHFRSLVNLIRPAIIDCAAARVIRRSLPTIVWQPMITRTGRGD